MVINPKIGVLGHMLLHKSYINVAIANILVYRKSLYDLPEPKYKNLGRRETLKKGVARNALVPLSTKMVPRPNVFTIV